MLARFDVPPRSARYRWPESALHEPRRCGAAAVLLVLHAIIAMPTARAQVQVRVRAKQTLMVDHLVFKDLNANGRLDGYEEWRLPVAVRVRDLASRMTLEEKAGMLLINTLNAEY